MRYAHTPRGQPLLAPRDMRSCAEGWQVPEALSLLGGPLLRLWRCACRLPRSCARRRRSPGRAPSGCMLGAVYPDWGNIGHTRLSLRFTLSQSRVRPDTGAAVRAAATRRRLRPRGPAVFALGWTPADHRRLASPVQEDQDAPAPYPFTGHGSCGSPWSSRKLPSPWW